MSPKVKKIIAREWLFFLVFLILGTPIGGSLWATYEWARAARLLLPDRPLEEMGALQIVLKYGELVNKHLYSVVSDTFHSKISWLGSALRSSLVSEWVRS